MTFTFDFGSTLEMPTKVALAVAGGVVALAIGGLIHSFAKGREYKASSWGNSGSDSDSSFAGYSASRDDRTAFWNRDQYRANSQLEGRRLHAEEERVYQEGLGEAAAAQNELAHLRKLEESLKKVIEVMKEALRDGFLSKSSRDSFLAAFKILYISVREAESYLQTVDVDTSLVARDLQLLRNKAAHLAEKGFFLKRHLRDLAASEQLIMQKNKEVKDTIAAIHEESGKQEYLQTLQLIAVLDAFPHALAGKMYEIRDGSKKEFDAPLKKYLDVLVVFLEHLGNSRDGLILKALTAQEQSRRAIRSFLRLFRQVEGELGGMEKKVVAEPTVEERA